MPIEIRLKGNKETQEYQDALALKEIFIRDIPTNVDGEVLIVSNATLFGQETKDIDLIVLGNFKDIKLHLKSKSRNPDGTENQLVKRDVIFKTFCFVIETKHHVAHDIVLNGINLCVRYNNRLADATTQSEKQKYALKNFFNERINFSPYICNFIWLRNLDQNSLGNLVRNDTIVSVSHNYLPSNFNIKWLFQLACLQKIPFMPHGRYNPVFNSLSRFNNQFDLNQMNSIFNLFEEIKQGAGELTRKKMEFITKSILYNNKYAEAIGEKLVVINGRAGTGKTIKLLRIACDLALDKNKRCLILTYNHALASDIKRILALTEIPNQIDKYSISIITLHKFFYELLLGFGIVKTKFISDYLENYNKYILELFTYIDNGVVSNKDIQDLMVNRHDEVAWDYVMIDEAQDWDIRERDLLFRIFTHKRILITDGIDQLIRNQTHCDWLRGLRSNYDFFKKKAETKSLRQKVNLVKFIHAFADEIGIGWDIEPKQELGGGKVLIKVGGYSSDIHNVQFSYLIESLNRPYEMLFLVPPSLVKKDASRSFLYKDEFQNMGIKIWDGTNTDLRTQYTVNLEEHRLFQYDSCRGLEGWTVVCLEFDEFINYKMRTYKHIEENEQSFLSPEEKLREFVNLWSLIPLTRAIDTIIITLKNRESVTAKTLYKIHQKFPDWIDWIE